MITRRFGPLVVALALVVPLGCGKDDGSGEGVASIDEASDDGSSDSGSGGGSGDAPSREEFQDAALEHAACMREQGIEDFPDPEFSGEGGMSVQLPAGIDEGDLEAAEEECQHIMDGVAPDAGDIDPEELAERQDRLLEVAECMRERGHDMPDPEVDDQGRVQMRGPEGAEQGGGEPGGEFQQDMEECQEEAGMDMPGGARGGETNADEEA